MDKRDIGDYFVTKSGLKFEILHLKSGGMGVVYICCLSNNLDSDSSKNSVFALKTFKPELLLNPEAREAFRREIIVWLKLTGIPHIMPALALEFVDDRPCVLMPAVQPDSDGVVTLRDVIVRRSYGLSPQTAFQFSLSIALGMSKAGEAIDGLVHGDLKPENIFLLRGQPHVADFGLAWGLSKGKALNAKGTLRYLAPECWSGDQSMTPQSDIYAFGCILYECLTGQAAFCAKTIEQLEKDHRELAPTAVNCDSPDPLRRELAALTHTCLAKNPAKRPANFFEIVERLVRVGQDLAFMENFMSLMQAAESMHHYTSIKSELVCRNARTLLEIEEAKEALDLLETLPDREIVGERLRLMGNAQSMAGQDEKALIYFREYLENCEESQDRIVCENEIAMSLKRLGEFAEANSIYERLLIEAPRRLVAMLSINYASSLLASGDNVKAGDLLRPLVTEYRDNDMMYAQLGLAEERSGSTEEAIQAYRRAIRLNQHQGMYKLHLARVLIEGVGNVRDAAAMLDMAYRQGIADREWCELSMIARVAMNQKDVAAAIVSSVRQNLGEEEATKLVDAFSKRFQILTEKFATRE